MTDRLSPMERRWARLDREAEVEGRRIRKRLRDQAARTDPLAALFWPEL